MKVGQISKYYYPVIGGIENHLQLLCEGIKEKVRLKVLVCNTNFNTRVDKFPNLEIIRAGSIGKVFSMPLSAGFPFWMKKIEADVLHFHHPFPLAILSYLWLRPKARLIVTYHSDIVRQRIGRIILRPFLINFFQRAEHIIATSPNMVENSPILKRFKEKCTVIPLGIDCQRFQLREGMKEEAEKIRRQYRKKIVLFVGRFIYYKGLEYLIRAIPYLDAHFILIGKGPLEKKLKKMIRNLMIEDKITILGPQAEENLALYYHACDLFVLPSVAPSEAFGLVQCEAMSCEKPVVSTNLPTGVPYVNLHEKTGLIVPPRNTEALIKAIDKLLNDEDLCRLYGRRARERVEREFNLRRMINRTLQLYGKIMGENNA